MIISPLSKKELEKIFNNDAQEVLRYFIFKAVLSQPELIPGQLKLPIHIPKEHIEQWGVQSLGLNSIGAGSYPIDLIDKTETFGADIKMLSWGGDNKESGETSLGQKFADSDLDALFVDKKYNEIIEEWKKILTEKFNAVFNRYKKLTDIYYFIFIRDGKKFHTCAMKVDTSQFSKMNLRRYTENSVWVDNFIEEKYGSIKIYKAKKRMELRLRPKQWIAEKIVITFDIENYQSMPIKLKDISVEDRYNRYKNDMQKIYKAYCDYDEKSIKD